MAHPIFTPQDAATLTARNLIKPPVRRRRDISSSLMFSEESSSSSHSNDSGVMVSMSFTIPEFLESCETLQYLGFEKTKAEHIWERWQLVKEVEQQSNEFKHDFFNYAASAIPAAKPDDAQENWESAMLEWGIGEPLQAAILDQEFANVRNTETAQFWVRDTMEIRYLTLERLQVESRVRSAEVSHTSTDSTPSLAVKSKAASNVPGHIVLYKAFSKDRVKQSADGEIMMESLLSSTPSDFRGAGGTTLVFTPDMKVAQRYAKYIRRRHEGATPVMIELSITNAFIEGLPPYVLPFGDLWKEVVFTSRRGLLLRGDLKRIHSLALLIGPISHSHSRTISSLENFHQISANRNVLYIDDKEATQYVFQGDEVMEKVYEHGVLSVVAT